MNSAIKHLKHSGWRVVMRAPLTWLSANTSINDAATGGGSLGAS